MQPAPPAGFADSLGLPSFQAHLLYNRGIRERVEVDPYLADDSTYLHDPMLLPDMAGAVDRIEKALSAGETIGVFGDFDVDGITGTALLVQAFQELGAKVVPYLPDRVDEGHGLNVDAIKSLRAEGVSLLVTVDCGSSSADEVGVAALLGVDVIVTDHHSLSDTPPEATALVNPSRRDSSYPYHGLTGAGLSFKLAEAVWSALGKSHPDHLLELAAMGTVADLGPLTGENRYLVKKGLERLNETRHPGLKALIARSGQTFGMLDTESLAFGLIPRLNAAGRLGDASVSLKLLTATSLEAAEPIAEHLEHQNAERRRLSEEGVAQAYERLETESGPIPPIIILEHEEWLPGILGLIAGNLTEAFYRPAVAVLVEGETCRASARSIPEFNIVSALHKSRHLFHRYGGHPRAAGFAMPASDLPRLKRELTAVADQELGNMDLVPTIDVDCEITPALLDDHNFGFIQSLSPFGEENPAPVFLTRNARVVDARQVGQQNKHLKMRVGHNGQVWPAIAFRQGDREVTAGDNVDLVYTASLNNWNGQRTLELNVLDFRPVGPAGPTNAWPDAGARPSASGPSPVDSPQFDW